MKKLSYIKNNKGLTLVEVIVSIAILAILALLVISTFALSIRIAGDNARAKINIEHAAAGIENNMAEESGNSSNYTTTPTEGNLFSVTINGVTINPDGKIIKSNDKNGDAAFYYFVPNE